MTEYTYGPGEWTALAHDGRAALLDPAIDAESVTRIWESLSDGGSLESWLEVLAGRGLASLPSFGFVEPADDGVRVVVRGGVTAVVEGEEIAAGGMRTWREHVAPAETGVVLQVEDSEVRHPLIGGLVLASTLQVGEVPEVTEDEDQDEDEDEAGAVVPVDVDADAEDLGVESGESEGAETEGAESEDVVPEVAEPEDLAPEVAESAIAVGDEPSLVEAGQGESQEAPAEESALPDEATDDGVEPDFVLDDDDDDDEEHTDEAGDESGVDEVPSEASPEGEWAESAEQAQLADLPDGQEAAGEQPVAPPAPQPWAVPAPAAPQANQWGPPLSPEGEQQPEQPWQAQAEPEQQPWQQPQPWEQPAEAAADQQPWQQQSEPAADAGDHDGYTMRAADLPQAEQAPEAVGDHTLAPAQEEEQSAEAAPAGPAMQLSLSTGQQVELDRPVLIGRAPESSRFGFGETPRLVTVPSPQQDISRTHVEIKLEGDSVLVTDLRSTNGTVVVLPGSPPRRLHPGESVPVPDGTVVDLGDGVTAVVGVPGTAVPLAT